MAYFAELDSNSKVVRVVSISNRDITDKDGSEQEELGKTICKNLFGGNWVQTSYNHNFRKRYAGVGMYYDSKLDAFIPPKPSLSWILNEKTCEWEAPVLKPDDKKNYGWNEELKCWQEYTILTTDQSSLSSVVLTELPAPILDNIIPPA